MPVTGIGGLSGTRPKAIHARKERRLRRFFSNADRANGGPPASGTPGRSYRRCPYPAMSARRARAAGLRGSASPDIRGSQRRDLHSVVGPVQGDQPVRRLLQTGYHMEIAAAHDSDFVDGYPADSPSYSGNCQNFYCRPGRAVSFLGYQEDGRCNDVAPSRAVLASLSTVPFVERRSEAKGGFPHGKIHR
jgi:hypothetical protein